MGGRLKIGYRYASNVSPYSVKICLLDNLSTNQLAVDLVADWSTHGIVKLPKANFFNYRQTTIYLKANPKPHPNP